MSDNTDPAGLWKRLRILLGRAGSLATRADLLRRIPRSRLLKSIIQEGYCIVGRSRFKRKLQARGRVNQGSRSPERQKYRSAK
ncbi:hypothetical protein N7451_012828 [Penicillium sp. IBT 35674x]|nr:hypothetical protein N7451_012828 [Penicillium sp. IBT 35674x]